MNLVITIGDGGYFEHLELFASSLQHRAQHNGNWVVVEHGIPRDGKIHYEHPFSIEQHRFLEGLGAVVLRYGDLLNDAEVPVSMVENIQTRTRIFPQKQMICTLITKRFHEPGARACYFDADTYFQGNVSDLFKALPAHGVAVAPETTAIGEREWARSTLGVADLSRYVPSDTVNTLVYPQTQLCAGFFGGEICHLGRFTLLWMSLGATSLFKAHSDQPLLNLLTHFFGMPIEQLNQQWVLHLNDLDRTKLTFDDKTQSFSYGGVTPRVVHFNGKSRDLRRWVKWRPA